MAQLPKGYFETNGSWNPPKPARDIDDTPSVSFEGSSIQNGPMATLKRWVRPVLKLVTWAVGSVLASWLGVMAKRSFQEIDWRAFRGAVNDIAVGRAQYDVIGEAHTRLDLFLGQEFEGKSLGDRRYSVSDTTRARVERGIKNLREVEASLERDSLEAFRGRLREDLEDMRLYLSLAMVDLVSHLQGVPLTDNYRRTGVLPIKKFHGLAENLDKDLIVSVKVALLGNFDANIRWEALIGKVFRPLKWVGLAKW